MKRARRTEPIALCPYCGFPVYLGPGLPTCHMCTLFGLVDA